MFLSTSSFAYYSNFQGILTSSHQLSVWNCYNGLIISWWALWLPLDSPEGDSGNLHSDPLHYCPQLIQDASRRPGWVHLSAVLQLLQLVWSCEGPCSSSVRKQVGQTCRRVDPEWCDFRRRSEDILLPVSPDPIPHILNYHIFYYESLTILQDRLIVDKKEGNKLRNEVAFKDNYKISKWTIAERQESPSSTEKKSKKIIWQ